MSKELEQKIKDLVERYQLDRAYHVLWSRGLNQFQAGWLIQKALKANLYQDRSWPQGQPAAVQECS